MTELTIQFNYVQDCVVLLREDFSSAKIEFNMRQNASMEFLENLKQRFDDSDYYHVTRSLTDKIMPKGCHAEITDIFMDGRLL